MRKHRYFRFALMMLAVLICAPVCLGQAADAEELLNSPVLNLKVREANLHLALSKLTNCYRVPIGFEFALTDKEPYRGNIEAEMRAGTLREALDLIVKQDGRYEWKVMDGVINVYPKTERDEVLAAILETEVKHFSIKKGTSLFKIRTDIVNLPEIKSRLDEAQVDSTVEGFFGPAFAPAGRDFALEVSGARLRQVMNRIIRESAVKYWVVNRYGENNRQLILNF